MKMRMWRREKENENAINWGLHGIVV